MDHQSDRDVIEWSISPFSDVPMERLRLAATNQVALAAKWISKNFQQIQFSLWTNCKSFQNFDIFPKNAKWTSKRFSPIWFLRLVFSLLFLRGFQRMAKGSCYSHYWLWQWDEAFLEEIAKYVTPDIAPTLYLISFSYFQ